MEILEMDKIFNSLLKELKHELSIASTKTKVATSAKAEALEMVKSIAKLKDLCSNTKEEVRNREMKIDALEEKVDEYDHVMQWMENQYDEAVEDHNNIVEFMDKYYEEEVAKTCPQTIKKRWVKNQGKGKQCLLMNTILIIDLTLRFSKLGDTWNGNLTSTD